MARPIWSGTLTFGLLNIPVSLMPGERKVDLHFRMLDVRDKSPIRFERVNAETGEEVPWKDIVKAFEYDKGNYVVVEEEDIRSAAPDSRESVEVETFVDASEIDIRFFEKPYILVPGKKAEKGYVLLRETLRDTSQAGIARVVIRTRQYLCAVLPQGDALVLMLLRYPQELVAPDDYKLPAGNAGDYRVTSKELEMARKLIQSMSGQWNPDEYHDEFRQRLQDIIKQRVEEKGATAKVDEPAHEPEGAATNVVDFMALLQKSLGENKRTPAKKSVSDVVVKKKPAKRSAKKTTSKKGVKKAVKKTAAKKTTAKRSAKKTALRKAV